MWRAGCTVDRHVRLSPPRNIKFKTPLLGIGSLLCGGAGKTPVVAHCARYWLERGLKVGVLCRPTGDEDRWLSSMPGLEVFPTRHRLRSCQELDGKFDLLISDDGLEDRRLSHARWIRLSWGERAEGLVDLLPAGPCRSLERDHPEVHTVLKCAMEGEEGGGVAPLLFATGEPVNALGKMPRGALWAMAGIGRPERFFNGLERAGHRLEGIEPRPDHDRAFSKVLERRLAQGLEVAVTQKDAARLSTELSRHPRLYVAPLALKRALLPWDSLVDGWGFTNF